MIPRNPETIESAESLLIDAEIRELLKRNARGATIADHRRADAIAIARRALTIAIVSAQSDAEAWPKNWRDPWNDAQSRASAAAQKIEELCKALAPRAANRGKARLRTMAGQLAFFRTGLRKETPRSRTAGATRDAQTLMAALAVARKIEREIRSPALTQRRAAMAARAPRHDVERAAFVLRLAEGWIYLTGRRPSKAPDASVNPFLRLVDAAWKDWRGTAGVNFARAAQNAFETITNADEIALANLGPSWR